ncbi:uncharacterized protein [Lolium perenne]|uniref:uncharacterized protein n=1 Tax=Lolium perenne TaxID=4522 RepID=UPI0021F60A64|nr:uncharacterized protein LOC127339527 [Lolium perenne]
MAIWHALIMDARYVALCSLLVLVLNGDPTFAQDCRPYAIASPFCFSSMCHGQCWVEAKFSNSYVQAYKCDGSGFTIACTCVLCRN